MSATEQRQFVDTNVLIYAHDPSAGPKYDQAKALINDLWRSGAGCLSIQVFQEFYTNATRKLARPLAPELAVQIITAVSYTHLDVYKRQALHAADRPRSAGSARPE